MNQAHVDRKTIEMVAIDNLHFDSQNPRLPSSVDGSKQDAVLEWMVKDLSLLELMGSIGEHGYFAGEPLLVAPDGGETYVVVEGNRRLAAAKLLLRPELAPKRKQVSTQQASKQARERPDIVPCVIYKHRDEILAYLGYRHITGVKTWVPLTKAKYLEQLLAHTKSPEPAGKFRELAKMIGSRSDYVARLLAGLAVYHKIAEKDFFDIKDLDEDSINFSLLTTAMNYSNIVNFLGLERATDPNLVGLQLDYLKKLTIWIFRKNTEGFTRLGESRNLKFLNAIVANEKACAAFESGKPLAEAVILTEEPLVAFRTAIHESRGSLETARDSVHLVDSPSQAEADVLFEIRSMASDLRKLVIDRLNRMEEED